MRTISRCDHDPATVGGLTVIACADCGEVSFSDAAGFVTRRNGLARLFGQFDLVGSLPGLGAPGRQVLLYRPPDRRTAAALRAWPSRTWLEGDDGLWVSHDGQHLLLAHDAPWVTHHLLDGA